MGIFLQNAKKGISPPVITLLLICTPEYYYRTLKDQCGLVPQATIPEHFHVRVLVKPLDRVQVFSEVHIAILNVIIDH